LASFLMCLFCCQPVRKPDLSFLHEFYNVTIRPLVHLFSTMQKYLVYNCKEILFVISVQCNPRNWKNREEIKLTNKTIPLEHSFGHTMSFFNFLIF
jgi:hypothetical protein